MYAKLNRTAIRLALGLAAVGGFSVAQAGYAYPSDPVGFTRSGSWGSGYGYATSANDKTFGKIIHQPNGLKVPVPGKAVTMPVSYRLAQNAPRIAAVAIYANPSLRLAIGIAGWLAAAKIVWDEASKSWTTVDNTLEQSTGYLYKIDYASHLQKWHSTKQQACDANRLVMMQTYPTSYEFGSSTVVGNECRVQFKEKVSTNWLTRSDYFVVNGDSCPAGWYKTPAGCLQNPPPKTVTKEEFEDLLSPKPMPETVPKELPYPTPLPVEPSPGPWVNPEPGTNPQHRPLFVPTGDPVPNPNYNPNAEPSPENQPWIQPGVRLNPSPAPNDPFRIDAQPVDRPKPNPDPMPEPQPDNEPRPDDKPRPEDRLGLCDEYPDILACAKPELDTPEDEIPKTNKQINYEPENLFGGGSCPANKTMSIGGHEMVVWDWDASCGYIQNYMRPVILVLCAFAAFVIVSGGARQS